MNSTIHTLEPLVGHRPTIMIVDDEPEVRDSFTIILEDRYDLAMAETGEEALSALQDRTDIRMVFLDYKLPGISGLDVLRTLRQKGIRVPVVMVTGKGTRDTAAEAFHFEVEDYITKPFRVKEIEDAVSKILSRKRTEQTPLTQAKQIINTNLHHPPSTRSIARVSGMKYRKLLRQFKQESGTTITGFINARRIEQAKQYLRDKDWSIAEVGAAVGFKRQNYFTLVFQKFTGLSPSAYRKRYRNFL